MSLFSALSTAGTGVDAMQTWIDAAAANVANANDAVATSQPAYAEQTAVFTPVAAPIPGQPGGGVSASIAEGSTAGVITYDPTSALANSQGDVKLPALSIADQLAGLIQAQDGYQANTVVMARAIAAYQSGLTIGS